MDRAELFMISSDVADACKMSEVNATYHDMQELGIAKMPYRLVDIDLLGGIFESDDDEKSLRIVSDRMANEIINSPLRETHNAVGYTNDGDRLGRHLAFCKIRFRYRDGECYQVLCGFARDHWHGLDEDYKEQLHEYLQQAEAFKRLLVVLLATKEIVKTRTKDKLLALGIGKGKHSSLRPLYTTTLSLPTKIAAEPSDEPVEPGKPKRPHLRRGHIRHQHHGPKMQFTKTIWIEPCFVNGDETYTSSRLSYNTSTREVMEKLVEQDRHRHRELCSLQQQTVSLDLVRREDQPGSQGDQPARGPGFGDSGGEAVRRDGSSVEGQAGTGDQT